MSAKRIKVDNRLNVLHGTLSVVCSNTPALAEFYFDYNTYRMTFLSFVSGASLSWLSFAIVL